MKVHGRLLPFMALLLLLGCTTQDLPVLVLDEATNKPVGGVWVSYKRYYRGALQMHGGGSCDHVAAGMTDLDGRVVVSLPPSPGPGESTYSHNAYKSGCEPRLILTGKIFVARHGGSAQDRFAQLARLSSHLSCPFGEAKATVPIHEAIVFEAILLDTQMVDEGDRQWKIQRLCSNWARAAIGPYRRDQSSSDSERDELQWLSKNSAACFAMVTAPARGLRMKACRKSSDGTAVCSE